MTPLVVPFYVHPLEDPGAWQGLAAATGRIHRAVVNVHDGPGRDLDDSYAQALAAIPEEIGLVGYVPTGYGRRADDLVLADARVWRERYGIRAVMLDEVATAAEEHDRLVRLVAALRQEGATEVLGNPGTVPLDLALLDIFDLTCVFEGSADEYRWWAGEHLLRDSHRTWHLVHSCRARDTRATMALARRRAAGSLWISQGCLPQPWIGLNEELLL